MGTEKADWLDEWMTLNEQRRMVRRQLIAALFMLFFVVAAVTLAGTF